MRHVIPPNFGYVEENLYRCGVPTVLSFPFLERLKLRTVVYLAPDEPSEAFLNFVEDQEIRFVHLGKESIYQSQNPWNPISEDMVIKALKHILDNSAYPLLIMCNQGRHRTGTVVGCFRKLQGWNLTSILEEYRRYAGNKVRILNEQFIELFDIDLCSGAGASTGTRAP